MVLAARYSNYSDEISCYAGVASPLGCNDGRFRDMRRNHRSVGTQITADGRVSVIAGSATARTWGRPTAGHQAGYMRPLE